MFCLNGTKSELSFHLFPPLDLGDDYENWELGLLEITTFNTIPNIERGENDLLYIGYDEDGKVEMPTRVGKVKILDSKSVSARDAGAYDDRDLEILKGTPTTDKGQIMIHFPEGAYEIQDIEKHVLDTCERSNRKITFHLRANNQTLKSELYCSRPIDFIRPQTIGPMLGFDARVLEANKWHESDHQVNIIKVNVIRVTCNIVRGSYTNGVQDHTLHHFYPLIEPGFKIVEQPKTVVYLPLSTGKIATIVVRLEDQTGRLINFRGEEISVRLHLRYNASSRLPSITRT